MKLVIFIIGVLCVACTTVHCYPDARIVNGEDASIFEAPHMVSFRYFNVHFCGGSLIAPRIVLTAAHCTDGLKFIERMTVRAGSSYEAKGGVEVNVTEVVQHEKWDDNINNYDIAMLYLEEDILSLSPIAKLVKLATKEPEEGEAVTVFGWGILEINGDSPEKLRKVTQYIITREDCQGRMKTKTVTINMICAYEFEKDSCEGDSGGGILDSKGVQVGITSWGIGCAFKRYPAVYTNIAQLQPWIQEKMALGPK